MNPELLRAVQALLSSAPIDSAWADVKRKSFLGAVGRSIPGIGKSAPRTMLGRGLVRLHGGGCRFANRFGLGNSGRIVGSGFPHSRLSPATTILQAPPGLKDWLQFPQTSAAIEQNDVGYRQSKKSLTMSAMAGLADLVVGRAGQSIGIDRPPGLSNKTPPSPWNPEATETDNQERDKREPQLTQNNADSPINQPTESEVRPDPTTAHADNTEIYLKWMEQAQAIGNERLRQADERIRRMRNK